MLSEVQPGRELRERNREVLLACAFFWRAKVVLCFGLVSGLVGGYMYARLHDKPLYASYVPVQIESKLTGDTSVALNLANGALASAAGAEAIFNGAVRASPAAAEFAAKYRWSSELFAASRPQSMKFLKENNDAATVYIRLPAPDTSGAVGTALVNAAAVYFQEQRDKAAARPSQIELLRAAEKLPSVTWLHELLAARFLEKSALEGQLYAIEQRLRLPVLSLPETKPLIVPARGAAEKEERHTRALHRIDDLMASANLSVAEASDLRTRLAGIVARSESMDLKYVRLIAGAEESVRVDLAAQSFDNENSGQFPYFRIDHLKILRYDGHNSEVVESRAPLLSVVGGICGVILALFAFALREFFAVQYHEMKRAAHSVGR